MSTVCRVLSMRPISTLSSPGASKSLRKDLGPEESKVRSVDARGGRSGHRIKLVYRMKVVLPSKPWDYDRIKLYLIRLGDICIG